MEKEFVPYELALRMKALGFDKPCFGYYLEDGMFIDTKIKKQTGNAISASTYSQAFRWFREKYDLLGIPTHSKYTIMSNKWAGQLLYGNYNSYEESELACLEKLIEVVEEKQKEDGR